MIIHASGDLRLELLDWLAPRLNTTPRDLVWRYPFEILGALDGERIIGAVLFMHHRGYSIEAHWAGEKGWLSRPHLRDIFAFPFSTIGVRRINGLIPKRNKQARKIAERLGFKLEGTLRGADDDGRDLMIYGMLRRECRWLTGDKRDGQGLSAQV